MLACDLPSNVKIPSFFKVAFHAVFLQLADGDQAVHGVPGKSANRLCDNEVYFIRLFDTM